ncbi:ATP synthase F1 subunit delta [Fusobacterium perfoetens]|uniref:ATP synthase F1 subunit delta n=1 Tax=Fusobacterium perfoetens TaxID=852 RepID=UPI00048A27E1|nr:ATP synthase F1 subunit delta [Fusobacterium perfoetens]MCI6151740.1 ATP synthase F1 subunit delta [Fusobacterium perfoetens]MDY3237856.1 ATP synthase F1 subunit delta [Fusobacterium perfoetens]
MADNKVGKRYAEAIYSVGESNNNLKEIYEALNLLMEMYLKDKEFKNIINHPLISLEEKKDFLSKIYFSEKEKVKDIIFYLLEKGRIIDIKEIVAEYLKIYYLKNKILDVEATFAQDITEKQRERLIKNLEKRTNKKINLKVNIDKSIIGGGILKIGDKIIDGTIKTQLKTLIKQD